MYRADSKTERRHKKIYVYVKYKLLIRTFTRQYKCKKQRTHRAILEDSAPKELLPASLASEFSSMTVMMVSTMAFL